MGRKSYKMITIDRSKVITDDNITKSLQVLIDNGIDEDEAETVLQAIGYTLIDTELFEDNPID